LEEADETIFWMELIIEAEILPVVKIQSLFDEANELLAIFATSYKTAKKSLNR